MREALASTQTRGTWPAPRRRRTSPCTSSRPCAHPAPARTCGIQAHQQPRAPVGLLPAPAVGGAPLRSPGCAATAPASSCRQGAGRRRRARLADKQALHADAGLAALVERAEDELGHEGLQLARAEVLHHARRIAAQLLRGAGQSQGSLSMRLAGAPRRRRASTCSPGTSPAKQRDGSACSHLARHHCVTKSTPAQSRPGSVCSNRNLAFSRNACH
jgi:hypothetical protein